jgi:hypothetical protein
MLYSSTKDLSSDDRRTLLMLMRYFSQTMMLWTLRSSPSSESIQLRSAHGD